MRWHQRDRARASAAWASARRWRRKPKWRCVGSKRNDARRPLDNDGHVSAEVPGGAGISRAAPTKTLGSKSAAARAPNGLGQREPMRSNDEERGRLTDVTHMMQTRGGFNGGAKAVTISIGREEDVRRCGRQRVQSGPWRLRHGRVTNAHNGLSASTAKNSEDGRRRAWRRWFGAAVLSGSWRR